MSSTTISFFAPLQLENTNLGCHQRSQASVLSRSCLTKISGIKHGFLFSDKQRLYYTTNRRGRSKYSIKMDLNALNNIASGTPVPPSGSPWSGWMLLLLVPLIIPLFQSKSSFLALKKKLGSVIHTVDSMSEVVEDVARKVDTIADDVVAKLPPGQFKEALTKFDQVAEDVIKAADLVQDVANRVDNVEKEVDDLIKQVEAEKQPANLDEKQTKDQVEGQAKEENLVENKPIMNQVDVPPKKS